MKIQNNPGSPEQPVTSDRVAEKPVRRDLPAGDPPEPVEPSADSASTSGLAARLEADPASQARVERLREAVHSGTYSVPASEVAAHIVDAHLNDLTKRS